MLDLLPAIVKHPPIAALGCLRRTSRLFRRLPCILAIPSSASDVHEKWGGTDFEEPHILSFLQALPNLKDLEVKRAYSLVGLGHLQPLERLTIYAHGHMDLRPLRRLKSLRHLHWQCRAPCESACLHELTQLTSLVYNTTCKVDEADICSLSNLQALGLMTLVESAFDLPALTALSSLSMFEQDLNMEMAELELLRCLYIRIQTVEGFLNTHMDTLLQLTAIAALTLDFSEASQQEVNLNDLQHLPNLQELCVRNCDSISQLRLYALTAFTFWSNSGGRPSLPRLDLCFRLQVICVFLGSGTHCLVSLSSLPGLSVDRPLYVRYATAQQTQGSIILYPDLLDGSRLRDGLRLTRLADYQPRYHWPHL